MESYSESTVLDITYEPQNDPQQIVQKKRNSIKLVFLYLILNLQCDLIIQNIAVQVKKHIYNLQFCVHKVC